ncbi:hypothetical protein CLIB1444_04S08460 [[Candida] jaroonii]|uniref:Uncharacterized protein n=1 Tax=[Candida] jaroonii TaxID=467808 RepID=A0ACA9Y743_9ASCO|nr:hypothetical protein CLIB1444_04S08460 [[Candida] jaroonii]
MVFKFTIDNWTNKFTPKNQLHRFPKPLVRFLGYHEPKAQPDYFIWLEILISSFLGILTLEGMFRSPNVFKNHNGPIIIASYGASAILCFNASQAPLAQPRSVILGHFSSALIGTCLEKLFSLSEGGRNHYYLGGALSVGVSSVVMSILNVVHPPAGASALLPFIDDEIRSMSWWILPMHLVSSVVIVGVACITGNVIRKYPVYWWTPYKKPTEPPVESKSQSPTPEKPPTNNSSEEEKDVSTTNSKPSLFINEKELIIPPELILDEVELDFLQSIQLKISELHSSPV